MKTIIIIKVLFPLFTLSQFSKENLKIVLNDKGPSETHKINSINNPVRDGSLYCQPDNAFFFTKQRFRFISSNELKKEMAMVFNSKADSFMVSGDYPNALEYFNRSLKINKEIDNKQGITKVLNSIAMIHLKQGDYVKSIEYHNLSLSVSEEINDKQEVLESLLNIAFIYNFIENYDKALDYNIRCLSIYEEIGNKEGVADCYNNIGKIFCQKGNYDKASNSYYQALAIQEELGNDLGIGITLSNIGLVYKLKGNHSSAIDYLKRSLAINKKIGNKEGIAGSLSKIGEIFQRTGNCDSAIIYSTTALKTAQEINQVSIINNATKVLYSAYKSTNQFKKALNMYELFNEINDSLQNKKIQNEKIHQEYKYKYDQKRISDSLKHAQLFKLNKQDRQRAAEKEKNMRFIFYLFFSLTLIIFGLILRIRSIKIQTEKDFLQKEIQVLKSTAIIHMALYNDTSIIGQLDRKKIDTATYSLLNDSDWRILTFLCKNPTINNREISEQISLSFEGVRSSLKKMYRIFKIHHSIENQRIALVIEATRISNSI